MTLHRQIALALVVCGCWATSAAAQLYSPSCACAPGGDGQTYRVLYQTVFDQQQVTSYRIEYETSTRSADDYLSRSGKPRCARRYTVGRPVQEASNRR